MTLHTTAENPQTNEHTYTCNENRIHVKLISKFKKYFDGITTVIFIIIFGEQLKM